MESIQRFALYDCLKATPRTEGNRRFLYIEASSETLDMQGESILAKALENSRDYYLKYGNLDLDHMTQIGLAQGKSDYALFEVGKPVEVQVQKNRTFVKGEIYTGDAAVAKNANEFWDSLTRLTPAMRWYPSVGGQVLQKSKLKDRTLVTAVRWTNIGFSKTPVNCDVAEVSAVPFGAFAKAWSADGFDLKALTAGYGTDAALKQGGTALGKQSLDPSIKDYWGFKNALAGAVRRKKMPLTNPESLAQFSQKHFGLSRALAAEWTERFLQDLHQQLAKRRTP
jgi:hypothetical protein